MKKITDHIYSIGVQNPTLRVFDIIFATEFGTSYNSFLVNGEKKAIIEAVHERFFDEFIENINEITTIKEISYLILNHTEPDHSGCVKKILEIHPEITIVASSAGHKYLSTITNTKYNALLAKDGDVLDLGGLTLKFISAPMLHWPDSIFTYCQEEQVLFTCDFLGAHYSEPRIFDSKVTYPLKYQKAFKDYFDGIFAPFKTHVLTGLAKIENLPLKFICTSHGPLLSSSIQEAMAKYRTWATVVKNEQPTALIIYVSAYGYTKKIALEIEDVLTNKYNIGTVSFDLVKTGLSNLKQAIEEADILFIGTPTINRDALKPIWEATTLIDAFINRGKTTAVFGSYGWSGEGVPMIIERLKSLKLNVIGEGIKIPFQPNQKDLNEIREYVDLVVNNHLN